MKRNNIILACTALLALGVSFAPAQSLVINEIRIDQPSTDNDEYFELHGTPGTSLSNFTYLVLGDGTGGSGVIEAVVSLAGQTIPADGHWFAAETTFTLSGATPDLSLGATGLNFENSDNVTHLLVDGFTGANGDDLDTDDDGVLDVTPWTSIIDSVSLIEELNPPTSTEYYYATPVGPDGAYVPGHIFRSPSGGSWLIGPFDPSVGFDTPGVLNAVPEPSTFALGGVGLLAMLLLRRRS